MITNENPLISQIRIELLFGLYTYNLPVDGKLSNAAILYGDNGVGKSTVLRLAFHLLSAAGNRGHRTALFQTEFKQLDIELFDGVTLSAVRGGKVPAGTLRLLISKSTKIIAIWDYDPNTRMRARIGVESDLEYYIERNESNSLRNKIIKSKKINSSSNKNSESTYMEELTKVVPAVFLLNAERHLASDAVADPSDEVEMRKFMHYSEPSNIHELVVRSREIGLTQALSAAASWIGKKAILSANQGSMNVHSVYGNVLRQLVSTTPNDNGINNALDIDILSKRLTIIESKTAKLAVHELATELSIIEFKKALTTRSESKRQLAANLVKPYIESLESRLDAVEAIYQLIDRFLKIINSLLSDKTLTYKLSNGFSIKSRLGASLEASHLSSGEQQLLLLFCYVLTARDNPSVFMIDEPEISLNVKWQRMLIQSLLDITKDSNIQFIFASHSMELLAQHKNRVVKLANNHAG